MIRNPLRRLWLHLRGCDWPRHHPQMCKCGIPTGEELAAFRRAAAERYARMIGADRPPVERAAELRRLSEGAPVRRVRRSTDT